MGKDIDNKGGDQFAEKPEKAENIERAEKLSSENRPDVSATKYEDQKTKVESAQGPMSGWMSTKDANFETKTTELVNNFKKAEVPQAKAMLDERGKQAEDLGKFMASIESRIKATLSAAATQERFNLEARLNA